MSPVEPHDTPQVLDGLLKVKARATDMVDDPDDSNMAKTFSVFVIFGETNQEVVIRYP
jgi:hypothetical protein